MVLMFFSILVLLFPICVSINTISLNQSLVDGDVLVSKEGTFALGFFSPGKSGLKYLGIWYYKLPGQDVVWVANRGKPINGSFGVLSMTMDGNLVLFSNQGRNVPMWSTNVSIQVKDACVAQLLDSGNMVLVQSVSGSVVWQSFDFPTHTMLPGMKLGLDWERGMNWFLTSWRSTDDPEIGDYSFKLNPAGSPQVFLYKGLNKRYRTIPWPWSMSKYAPDSMYQYILTINEDGIYFVYFVNDKSVLVRLVVDASGIMHRLNWDNNSRKWKESWSGPKYAFGHCGAYSLYSANNGDTFECSCFPGYKPRSLKEWNLRDGTAGCVRKHKKEASFCRSGEGFIKVEQVKVPDTSVAALVNASMSSEECLKLCLTNCSCMAFASIDVDGERMACLTWYGELIDVIKYSAGPDLYVRVDAVDLAENAAKRRSFSGRKSVIAGLSIAFTSCLIIIYCCFRLRQKKLKGTIKNKHMRKILSTLMENRLPESRQQHPDFPYFDPATILTATDNFSPANKLGQGGFGSVYKGKLADGTEIAVKRLSQSSGQGTEEFENEVMLIARLQHRNLVKLLGCCVEEELLIYEYLPNKSLDTFIFDQERRVLLDWRKRFYIIVGIARGMLYLHHDSRLRIIHRDLKTSNILLDAEMNPKISDFGVARIIDEDQVQDKTKRVVGTYGYMAPEYVVFGKFSIKSDVFSFGVILLEIISGRKNSTYLEVPQLNLIGHVWDLWRNGKALDIIDSSLRNSYIPSQVVRCIHIGLLCVQNDRKDRPTMADVLLMLNSEASLPFPKEPAFILQRNCKNSNSSTGEEGCTVNEVTITMIESR